MKKTCHIISHTHWDREWYLPYEKHHVKLIEMMDSLLEVLEKDDEFKSFHLDGHTIAVEDYLQVRPEKRDLICKFIEEKRISVGPWYILQDEFLTSSEANIRNLQIGHKDALALGNVSKLGYFPDSFGNMGQAPQILKQANIDTAFFGRGVKPTGFNNEVSSNDSFESPYSEMSWVSPDGSEVLGILCANWYNNAMEIPTSEVEAKVFWDKKIGDVEKFASTSHLLFLNGCDHQPVQTDLTEALAVARKLYPNIEFAHSSFDDYIKELKSEVPSDLKSIHGELRSQQTDGWNTLVNTASSRVYLKQMNQVGQTLLEKVAEPLSAFSYTLGQKNQSHLLTYSWKTLMQNHPHDSICGCSIDEVHREMVQRFEKSKVVAEEVVADSLDYISSKINTTDFEKFGSDVVPFSIFNTSGWEKTNVVTIELDLQRVYMSELIPPQKAAETVRNFELEGLKLVDSQGKEIQFDLEDLSSQFGYDLPKDRFRQPFFARKVKITFEAEKIPGFGYKSFALVRSANVKTSGITSMVKGERVLENDFIKLVFADDGSFKLEDKVNRKIYHDQCVYEDVGDIGNEYVFAQPKGDKAITTKGLKATIEVVEDSPYRATFKISHNLEIPKSANEMLQTEINEMVRFTERRATRSTTMSVLQIETFIQLERSGRSVRIRTTFNNQSTDHRLRVMIPTDLESSYHLVDSIFELAKRDNVPAKEWTNPSNCQHQHAFVSVSDAEFGLTVANKGLNEYEVLRDGRNTIAVTLLRAVEELGDWGVFHTPDAQCLGEQTVEFEIIPHAKDVVNSNAFSAAYNFQVPFAGVQHAVKTGEIPADYEFVEWNSDTIAISNIKLNNKGDDVMIRCFNTSDEVGSFSLETNLNVRKVYKSNVLEERIDKLSSMKEVTVNPAEIVTIGLSL